MTGRALMIVSPSISSTSRRTPCEDGCWGPKLSAIRSSPAASARNSPQSPPETVWTLPSVVSRDAAKTSGSSRNVSLAVTVSPRKKPRSDRAKLSPEGDRQLDEAPHEEVLRVCRHRSGFAFEYGQLHELTST